ncbi:hypothetical protein [Mucilaginibacter sp.]|uniref:hypothetical protein n=1 Tax=Mucilaginibacter sp. TaxID=1882438 RepID=UPI0025F7FEF1|nr:hypothetical protein [Mucilaginibacter sp.]
MENTVESDYILPVTFTIGNSYLAWGILCLTMAAGMAVIMLLKGFEHADKEFYIGILLIIMLGFCGVKLIAKKFNCIVIAAVNQVIAKSIFGKPKCILWTEIETITLVKKGFEVKSSNEQILIPFEIKQWELLLEILEDHARDENFIGFD